MTWHWVVVVFAVRDLGTHGNMELQAVESDGWIFKNFLWGLRPGAGSFRSRSRSIATSAVRRPARVQEANYDADMMMQHELASAYWFEYRTSALFEKSLQLKFIVDPVPPPVQQHINKKNNALLHSLFLIPYLLRSDFNTAHIFHSPWIVTTSFNFFYAYIFLHNSLFILRWS